MTQAMEYRSTDPEKACIVEREFEAVDEQLHDVLGFLEEELEKLRKEKTKTWILL